MEVTFELVGTKPLLLHSVDLANPLNPYAKKMTELRGTPSKRRTEQWFEEMSKANFLGAFYDIPEVNGIAIPCENARRSLVVAAKASRQGTTVERALTLTVPAVPLMYDGPIPATPAQLWEDPRFRVTRMIRGTGGASPTTYPKFEVPWATRVPLELDESIMNLADLQELASRAGRIEGIGASRKQGFGRYEGIVKAA